MSFKIGNCRLRPFRPWTLAALLLLAGSSRLFAHNIAPEPTVEIFLRATGDHLAVTVWLPIAALTDANLPRTPDGHFIANEIRPALDLVARGIARDLALRQDDDSLATSAVTTTLSPDESFVAIDLDYRMRPGDTNLSARFHTFLGNGQLVATQVHYVVDDRTTRTFIVDGPPQRISFAPSVVQVLQYFVDKGTGVLFDGADFLLFAVCLIAVGRTAPTMMGTVGTVLAGQVLAVMLSAGGLLALPPSSMLVLGALGASAIVVLAIQDVASPRSRWLPLLCFAFGATSGAAIGARLLHEWSFAGTHVIAGLFGFVSAVSIGEVWVIGLLWSAGGLIRRRGRIAELAVLSTAIFAGHAALHRVVDQSQAIADAGTFALDRFLFTLTVTWACLILCAGILDALLSARANARAELRAHPGNIGAQ